MSREQRIKEILVREFQPVYFELENESQSHSVPENSETHFRLLLVSERFNGLTRVARQQLVMGLLKEEFQSGLHAFTQRLLNPTEWQGAQGQAEFVSPSCHGGSKGKN